MAAPLRFAKSAFISFLLLTYLAACGYPNDAAMTRRFHRDEVKLTQFVNAFYQRKDIRYIRQSKVEYFNSENDGEAVKRNLTEPKEAELQTLLTSLGLEQATKEVCGNPCVYLQSKEGIIPVLSMQLRYKGFVYTRGYPKGEEVPSLDNGDYLTVDWRSFAHYYKPIKDNWYLYLEIVDF